jgi:hypothetical protein
MLSRHRPVGARRFTVSAFVKKCGCSARGDLGQGASRRSSPVRRRSQRGAASRPARSGRRPPLSKYEPVGQRDQRRDDDQSEIAARAADVAKHGRNRCDQCSSKKLAVEEIEHSGGRRRIRVATEVLRIPVDGNEHGRRFDSLGGYIIASPGVSVTDESRPSGRCAGPGREPIRGAIAAATAALANTGAG